MVDRGQEPADWRRWLLGGKDSWRRVVLAGAGAGLVLATAAALAVAFIGDGSGGALDKSEPTAIAPAGGPGGPPVTIPDVLPTEEPIVTPTEPVVPPTEPPLEPTEPPVVEPTLPPPPTEPPAPTLPPVEGAP